MGGGGGQWAPALAFLVPLALYYKRKVRHKVQSDKGSFTNYVDKILALFDHLPTCVDIFYGMNVDKNPNIFGPPFYLFL